MALRPESLRGPTQQRILPTSPTFSAAETAADSNEQSLQTCLQCRELFRTFPDGELPDPEENLDMPCHGWPELVKVMVDNPGFEAFQAFRSLHIKSLLY